MRQVYTQEQLDEARKQARNEGIIECLQILTSLKETTKNAHNSEENHIFAEEQQMFYIQSKAFSYAAEQIEKLIRHKDEVAILTHPETPNEKGRDGKISI